MTQTINQTDNTDSAKGTGNVNLMAVIAKSIAGGVFIPSALAAELNISSKELSDRLFMMNQMGFIAKDKPAASCGSTKCCCGCNSSECGNSALSGSSYVLTEKGKKLLKA